MAEVPYSFPLLLSNQWARGIYLGFCCSNSILVVAFCFSTAYTSNGSSQEYLPKKLWPELKEVSTFKGERMIQPL